MQITADVILKLYLLTHQIDVLREQVSEALKAAKQHQDTQVSITRRDGNVQEVTERMLWDEVRHLGDDSEASAHLRTTYPVVFEKDEELQRKSAELREFTLANLDMDSQAIRVSDIVRLIDGMVDFKLNERDKARQEGGAEARTHG